MILSRGSRRVPPPQMPRITVHRSPRSVIKMFISWFRIPRKYSFDRLASQPVESVSPTISRSFRRITSSTAASLSLYSPHLHRKTDARRVSSITFREYRSPFRLSILNRFCLNRSRYITLFEISSDSLQNYFKFRYFLSIALNWYRSDGIFEALFKTSFGRKTKDSFLELGPSIEVDPASGTI